MYSIISLLHKIIIIIIFKIEKTSLIHVCLISCLCRAVNRIGKLF